MAHSTRTTRVPRIPDIEFVERLGAGLGEGRYRVRMGDGLRLGVALIVPGDGSERARVARWAEHLSEVRHPGIPAVERVSADEPGYVVFQYVEGGDLVARMTGEGPLDDVQALSVTLQAAAALHAAHLHGVGHGGLGPRCAVLTERPGALDAVHIVGWAPPDPNEGLAELIRRDVRGLGVVLYSALTGSAPPPDAGADAFELMRLARQSGRELGGIGRFALGLLAEESPVRDVSELVERLHPLFRVRVQRAIQRLDEKVATDRAVLQEVARKQVELTDLEEQASVLRTWLAERDPETRRAEASVDRYNEYRTWLRNADLELNAVLRPEPSHPGFRGAPALPGRVDSARPRAISAPPARLRPETTSPPRRADEPAVRVRHEEATVLMGSSSGIRARTLAPVSEPPGRAPVPSWTPVAHDPEPTLRMGAGEIAETMVAAIQEAAYGGGDAQAAGSADESSEVLSTQPDLAELAEDEGAPRRVAGSVQAGPRWHFVLLASVIVVAAFAVVLGNKGSGRSAPPPKAPAVVTAGPVDAGAPDAAKRAPADGGSAAAPEPGDGRPERPPRPPPEMVAVRGGVLRTGLDPEHLQLAIAQCERDYPRHKSERGACRLRLGREREAEPVQIGSFFLDAREVSQADFDECTQAGRCPRLTQRWDMGEQPASGVTLQAAESFCEWRGGRLPTIDEWMYAARGHDDPRLYPWGDAPPVEADRHRASFGAMGRRDRRGSSEDGHRYAAPVGAFESRIQTPFGAANQAGNMREWTATKSGAGYVVAGGGWQSLGHELRVTYRTVESPGTVANDIGFRCARDVPVEPEQ